MRELARQRDVRRQDPRRDARRRRQEDATESSRDETRRARMLAMQVMPEPESTMLRDETG